VSEPSGSFRDLGKYVSCPYCWHTDTLSKFIVPRKNVALKIRWQCPDPECRQLLNVRVLDEFTLTEKAQWLCINVRLKRSPHNRYVERVKWELIFKRMDKIDATEFWRVYREMKESMGSKGEEVYRTLLVKAGKSDNFRQMKFISYQQSIEGEK